MIYKFVVLKNGYFFNKKIKTGKMKKTTNFFEKKLVLQLSVHGDYRRHSRYSPYATLTTFLKLIKYKNKP